MALNLVKAGSRLLVWNRTPVKAEILAAAGAEVARDPADVFARSSTVILMLVDGKAIDTVLCRGGRAFADEGGGTNGRPHGYDLADLFAWTGGGYPLGRRALC